MWWVIGIGALIGLTGPGGLIVVGVIVLLWFFLTVFIECTKKIFKD